MHKYLKIIRWPNSVIVTISMSFLLLFIICPTLGTIAFTEGMSALEFIMLVVSTLLIAIGGYIVNDIFDINTDSINKPKKNIIGQSLSIDNAYRWYWITTIAGVAAGTLLSYLVNQINFSLVFLFCAGLLWFYAQKYQCQPLIGNVVIAVLSSLSFGLVWLFEFYALSNNAQIFTAVQSNFPLVNRLVLIYMTFAFMVTMLRELVKDIEDYKGDNRFGCMTFVIKFGISTSKLLALIIAYISLLGSIFIQYYFLAAGFSFLFTSFFVIDALFILIIVLLHKSKTKSNYSKISLLLKILMLSGVLSMIMFYFEN